MIPTMSEEANVKKRTRWNGSAGYSEGLTDLRRMVAGVG
jgi:hypothetical protein